ncbi:molybdopterin-dependent oxidoreductase [Clostridium sp. CCUG 7971]|uniref:molybdopterin-dependent oxidoreductase n=1 Tax=Clostridium sp. CCUG 7971 TaxID=2811414 RepID=UPI001ABA633D|nr:molybdopterin-dependent oxidoreductase [Clostridium sp. CCUG 7971]MBO3445797.1 molybdopterin-dependent oxidoreductase [Clostridium sp. CCUG 7971]
MEILSHGCTLDCFDACKFNVYVENNKVIKIEGDKNHPYTKGFICNKGRSHLDRLNHKDRITTPLLKVKDKWVEISFNEAIQIMVKKLSYYKETYTSKSVLYYTQYGSGSLLKDIGDIFTNFYGGVSKSKGGPCWSAGIKAQKYDFGVARSHSLEDMFNSKNIFIWGKNPAYTTIHTMQTIKKAKEKGAKIIVIDPIYTQTAKIADIYIRINPGSDGALAAAMSKIIIDEKIYDKEYINSYVLGFEEYKSYIEKLDLNYLSNECGVEINQIKELVKLYTQKYSTICLGYGMQKYKNGGNTIRLIDSLGAITGQIGFSGGGVNYANKVYSKYINTDPYESESFGENREFYTSKISKFINDSFNANNIPIKMTIITKSNLLNQLPNLVELEDAFSKIDFKVCFDMFMTDTASKCDLFIPCTNTLESEDILYSSMTNPYIIYNEKAVEPNDKLMDEYYFFMELAKAMKINNYPYVSKYEYLNEAIKPLKKIDKDINLEKIRDTYFTIQEYIAWEDKVFDTPSKMFELYSKEAEKDGLSPIPIYISTPKQNKFRLLTNHHRETLFSQHYIDKNGISKAYINENMAIKVNIENKEVVRLKNKNITIETEINIDNSISDYVVMMYVGWWKKHGNPNYIADSDISDMGGQVTYNETFIDIIKQK